MMHKTFNPFAIALKSISASGDRFFKKNTYENTPLRRNADGSYNGTAFIDRVVSGNLVYVTSSDHETVFACTPKDFRFRRNDGTVKTYRGETLSSLGIYPGVKVSIENEGGRPIVAMEYTSE